MNTNSVCLPVLGIALESHDQETLARELLQTS